MSPKDNPDPFPELEEEVRNGPESELPDDPDLRAALEGNFMSREEAIESLTRLLPEGQSIPGPAAAAGILEKLFLDDFLRRIESGEKIPATELRMEVESLPEPQNTEDAADLARILAGIALMEALEAGEQPPEQDLMEFMALEIAGTSTPIDE